MSLAAVQRLITLTPFRFRTTYIASAKTTTSSMPRMESDLFVIVASPSRSCTGTMRKCLQILWNHERAFYHGVEYLGERKTDVAIWCNLIEKKLLALQSGISEDDAVRLFKRADFDPILKDFHGTSDLPSFLFFRELLHVYPNSKVILSLRPPLDWARSFIKVILPYTYNFENSINAQMIHFWQGIRKIHFMVEQCFRPGLFIKTQDPARFDPFDLNHMQQVYANWLDHVQKHVPRDRLLLYSPATDGWAPLCRFLDRPEPDCAIPHENKPEVMIQLLQGRKTKMELIEWALLIVEIIVVSIACYVLFR